MPGVSKRGRDSVSNRALRKDLKGVRKEGRRNHSPIRSAWTDRPPATAQPWAYL